MPLLALNGVIKANFRMNSFRGGYRLVDNQTGAECFRGTATMHAGEFSNYPSIYHVPSHVDGDFGGSASCGRKVASMGQGTFKNDSTRSEIESLLADGDEAALKSRMDDGKLSFGTAGIRAKMGAGFARLNDLTIIQISQGMALYLRSEMARQGREHSGGIAIGFDGRYNSRRFSELAANVFTQNGIGVYLFSDVVPTPVASFATADLKCDAGVMITASHNPKEDNGYKVYWSNGAQIIAPHDVEICRFMAKNAEPKDSYWELSRLHSSPLLKSADCCLERYFDSESRMCFQRSINEQTSLNFTYSAFHGVGSRFATEMFRRYGIRDERVHHVALQDEPDPSFPTVPFPNPEEGVRVLKLCVETANETNSRIILANDPDADRMQMAERQSDGEWRIFTGNEMGAVLTWWIWTNWQRANPGADLSKVYILTSAVSSQIVQTMAAEEGFRSAITLTGFKWMGNLADDFRKRGNEVILAWEESIGFMAGSTLDKDGISAAAIFAEIAIALHAGGRKVSDQLYEIYREYGFHLVRSSYWIVPTPLVTERLFAELRQSYPPEIDRKKVKYVRDLTTGFDNSRPDNKAVLPISTSSEMITFTLDTGSTITLRASGTEPKIKYYLELKTEKGKRPEDLSGIKKELDNFEENVVQLLLRPGHYGLKHRDSH